MERQTALPHSVCHWIFVDVASVGSKGEKIFPVHRGDSYNIHSPGLWIIVVAPNPYT